MPANVRIPQADFAKLQRKLKSLDKELYNEFRREMRAEMKPYAEKLQGNIPSESPLSGMDRRRARPRAPYIYKKPRARISVGTGRVSKKSLATGVAVVSIVFGNSKGLGGFSIMETAGAETSNRVDDSLQGIGRPRRGHGSGRFVIPQFYEMQSQVERDAVQVIEAYSKKATRRLAALKTLRATGGGLAGVAGMTRKL